MYQFAIDSSIAPAYSACGLSAPLYAGPFDKSEVAAMAYASLPFGGVSRSQEAPILGFAVNHSRREQGNGFSYHSSLFQQPPVSAVRSLMDVRYNTEKQNWDRFRVGGVDALTYKTRLNADGTVAAEAAEISTPAIGAGVVVGVVVINEATKKDDPPAGASGGPPSAAASYDQSRKSEKGRGSSLLQLPWHQWRW
ncbi:MAG: hypothetical protein D4R84_17225 [Rhodocyclaceae bacterium]|nr:MAG: hypothetical protein D4R84_17225 [Rhodocyclaceae bacterium]